jgi:hypothetical protein
MDTQPQNSKLHEEPVRIIAKREGPENGILICRPFDSCKGKLDS